jgi:hypothetical protein
VPLPLLKENRSLAAFVGACAVAKCLGLLILAAFVLTAAILVTLGFMAFRAPGVAGAPPVVRSELSVRPAEELNAAGAQAFWVPTGGGSRTALAWTPDGRALVFVGRRGGVQQLYVRSLDAEEARPLAGTEGAQAPAVSPDGQWVAFWAPGVLKKVPLAGGPAEELMSGIAEPPTAVVWGSHGRVFFGMVDGPVWQIPVGGTPTPVTRLGEAGGFHIPWSVLPGDRVLLYTPRKRVWTWGDEEVIALDLSTGAEQVLLRDAVDARYIRTGHLVFLRRSVLFAVPFDPERLAVGGPPVPMLEGVAQALTAGYFRRRHRCRPVHRVGERIARVDFERGAAGTRGRAGRGRSPRSSLVAWRSAAELLSGRAGVT